MIYLILLFTLIPMIELAIIIKVGSYLGVFKTIILLVMFSVLGAYLARMQGFLVLKRIQNSLEQGLMPTEEMLDGFLILVAGILLLTPGFLTDLWGLFLLLPWTRALIKIFLRRQLKNMVSHSEIVTFRRSSSSDSDRFDDIDI